MLRTFVHFEAAIAIPLQCHYSPKKLKHDRETKRGVRTIAGRSSNGSVGDANLTENNRRRK